MTDTAQDIIPAGGDRITSYIEVYTRNNVVLKEPPTFERSVACLFTKMSAGGRYYTGSSSIVNTLTHIYGNHQYEHIPVTLSGETITIGDTTNLLVALLNWVMATKSILTGRVINIVFGPFYLNDCVISDASLRLQPGTLGASIQMTVLGTEGSGIKEGGADAMNEYNNRITTDQLYTPDASNEFGIIRIGGRDGTAREILQDVTIMGMAYIFRENIKVTGELYNKGVAYPPPPIQIAIDAVIHLEPQITMGSSKESQTSYGSKTYNLLKKAIMVKQRLSVVTPYHGITEILIQDMAVTHQDSRNISISIYGNLLDCSQGPDEYWWGDIK